jgi:hypothetical protein
MILQPLGSPTSRCLAVPRVGLCRWREGSSRFTRSLPSLEGSPRRGDEPGSSVMLSDASEPRDADAT